MDKDFDLWYQVTGQISLLIYFILSLKYYNLYRKLIVQISSNADAILFKWIKNYLIAFLIMIVSPYFFDVLTSYFSSDNSYQNGWWFYLFYSLVLYYIAITGYANSAQTKIGFQLSVFDKNPILLTSQNNTLSAQEDNKIDIEINTFQEKNSPEIDLWKSKIETLIQEQKLYQNPELSLTEISKKLQTNASVISKAINQGFAMNFNDFINNYRIEAVKEMFVKNEHKKSTLLGIAYDCGL